MIFDNLALYPNKTGFQNIANPLCVSLECDSRKSKTKVRDVAAKLKIAQHSRPIAENDERW